MFCPKCGLQQATETTRFCSRCGFQLGVTTQLLANNGMLPMNQQPFVVQPKTKPKGLKRGVILLLLSVVLFPIFFGAAIAADTPAPLIVPVTLFLAGLAWTLYSYVFKEDGEQVQGTFQQPFMSPQRQHLPPPQDYSVTGFHQGGLTTGELVPPTSVTEGTTTLFDKER